jgi:hypothetical protein
MSDTCPNCGFEPLPSPRAIRMLEAENKRLRKIIDINEKHYESKFDDLVRENRGLRSIYRRQREALDLMVDTYKNGGWPTATIEIAKSALQESSVQEAGDE